MMMQPSATTLHPVARFPGMRWSLVMTTIRADPAVAQQALQELCTQYWFPVYTYLRHDGHPPVLAQEICIAFFEDLLRSPALVAAEPTQGRFRDFLLAALHRFLSLDWRETAEYRDDGPMLAPVDSAALEERQRHEPAGMRPDHAFHRAYALDLIASALRHLRTEAIQVDREAMFEALSPYLRTEADAGRLDQLARQLDTRPLALVLALQRLRQRFRELIETEIAQTVGQDIEHAHERTLLLASLQ